MRAFHEFFLCLQKCNILRSSCCNISNINTMRWRWVAVLLLLLTGVTCDDDDTNNTPQPQDEGQQKESEDIIFVHESWQDAEDSSKDNR